MSGDAHVQFWEGLGVRLPGATQQNQATHPNDAVADATN